jgi:molybdopterin/thiamine biosynthesis adenylyltransferase/rhodanese-related sulfurtransferase
MAEAQALNAEERERYSRHILVPQVGEEGQRTFKKSKVLVIGAGGLGSPVITYLAAAGIGTIGIVDGDTVSLSNLQRQVIHSSESVGAPKVESAANSVRNVNPNVTVIPHSDWLRDDNVVDLIRQYDLVIDGSDNYETRFLVNDACVLTKTKCVWGSVFQFSGQAAVFDPGHGPCYRCLYEEAPPAELTLTCAEGGVLGALCASVGAVMTSEALKILLGIGEPLIGRLWTYDALAVTTRVLRFERRSACSVCGDAPTIQRPSTSNIGCSIPDSSSPSDLTPFEASERLKSRSEGHERFQFIDVRQPSEWQEGHLDGARLVPLGSLNEFLAAEPSDDPIIFYCQSGGRSSQALATATAFGRTAAHIVGGYSNWVRNFDGDSWLRKPNRINSTGMESV